MIIIEIVLIIRVLSDFIGSLILYYMSKLMIYVNACKLMKNLQVYICKVSFWYLIAELNRL